MKKYILLTLLLLTSLCKAAHKVKIYYEQHKDGYSIYADNDEFCPMSIKVAFTLENLNLAGENNAIYVVNAKTKRQLLTTLKITKRGKAYKVSYKYWSNYGTHDNKDFDIDYVYDLPYKKSNAFKIHQGYNGAFSHRNENSLDFTMPIGTELLAVRAGIVIRVVDSNDKGCANEECKKFSNFITLYHSDGTFAEYAHIRQNGSEVKIGDHIDKGQLIGYSGNVGWTTGPHLHLVLFNQNIDHRETLKTKFRTGDGSTIEYLEEKKAYLRNY